LDGEMRGPPTGFVIPAEAERRAGT